MATERFEVSLKKLEEMVRRLESGELPLEDSLDLFERGIRLSRELQASLQAASLRVTRLLEGPGGGEAPLDAAEESPRGGESGKP